MMQTKSLILKYPGSMPKLFICKNVIDLTWLAQILKRMKCKDKYLYRVHRYTPTIIEFYISSILYNSIHYKKNKFL